MRIFLSCCFFLGFLSFSTSTFAENPPSSPLETLSQRGGWLLDTPLSRPASPKKNMSQPKRIAQSFESDRRYYRRLRRKSRRNWRRSRFWWSVELGSFMHYYNPFQEKPPTDLAYNYNGFLLAGRWGYASGSMIITGDLLYAMSDGMMIQLGATFGFALQSYLILEVGTGFNFVYSSALSDPGVYIPVDAGITLRIPMSSISLGVRLVGSTAIYFGDPGGMMFNLRVSLVLSRL